MKKYRSKVTIVEAMQFEGLRSVNTMLAQWKDFHEHASCGKPYDTLRLETLHGEVDVLQGDWVVKGPIPSDYYPCKPEAFVLEYGEVN